MVKLSAPVKAAEVPALRERLTRVYAEMETSRASNAEVLRVEANRIESLLRDFDRWHACTDSSSMT